MAQHPLDSSSVLTVRPATWIATAAAWATLLGAGCIDVNLIHSKPDGGGRDVVQSIPDASAACDASGVRWTIGRACSCDSECLTGHCVEGVCCNEACTNGCQTCTAPGAPGICSPREAGILARTAADCQVASPSTCGFDGRCDGKGSCRRYTLGVSCGPGTCEGSAVVGASVCDGLGNCLPGPTLICTPFSCDPQSGGCFDMCNGAAECDSGHSCNASGSCGTHLTGAACASNNDCASGFCSDGVCCNTACLGACVTCNVAGRLGTCVPSDAGRPDPHGVCTDQGAASCGHDGTCDGAGGCANYSSGTQCLQPSCVGNHISRAATCDGMGTCTSPGIQDCHPFRCVGDACTGSCQTDNDCDTGIACLNGSCGPKPTGASCAAASECASYNCVDGVCCASACTGACYSCALATSPGSCLPIAAGHVDARGVCQDGGAAACSTNGRCDGSGACQKYQAGTVCAAESCSSAVYSGPSTCNTTGQCVAPDALPCSPYVCNGSRCFDTCVADAQCLTPNRCTSNSCGRGNTGAACSTSAQCKSGFCAQGVCCDKACTGTCQSCALAGTVGVCTSVANGSVDPSGLCMDEGPSSCGTNGRCQAGSCQNYVSGTVCKSPSCPTGTTTFTGASTCDGAGTCVTPAVLSCTPFACGSNTCQSGCASNADCVSPAVCINGSCGLKTTGGGCASGSECSSGFCAQGVCCSTACNGACQSCSLSAFRGILHEGLRGRARSPGNVP